MLTQDTGSQAFFAVLMAPLPMQACRALITPGVFLASNNQLSAHGRLWSNTSEQQQATPPRELIIGFIPLRKHHPGSDQQCRQTNLTVAGNPGTTFDMAALPAPTSISFRLSLAAALQQPSVLKIPARFTRSAASCIFRMTDCRPSTFILQTRQ